MSFLDELKETRGEWIVQPRPDTEDPKSARCKLAFRRICGTCAHFDGALAAGSRPAPCRHLELQVSGHRSAQDCHAWTRRDA